MKSYALLTLLPSLTFATAPNPGSQWANTLFLDDFTGAKGAAPSTSNWIFDHGTQYNSPTAPANWGNDEVEYYTSSRVNIQQTGTGNLQITPRLSKSGNWTSARIETVSAAFQAPAGGKMRMEARLNLPNVNTTDGLGYWPSFWALGGNFRPNYNNWPSIGEFDIMETINGEAYVNQGLHCDVNPGGKCNEPDGLGKSTVCGGTSCVGAFHTYTLIVDRSVKPEQLEFQIDHVTQTSINQTTLGNAVWAETVHHGYYLILDVGIGGDYPNAIAGVTTPTADTIQGKSMVVDYVAVWTT